MVPLKSELRWVNWEWGRWEMGGEAYLVTGLDLEGLGSGGVVNVAGHVLAGDIDEGGVVGRGTDVARCRVAETLVNIIDPGGLDRGMGGSKLRCGSKGQESECLDHLGSMEMNVVW